MGQYNVKEMKMYLLMMRDWKQIVEMERKLTTYFAETKYIKNIFI